MFNSALRSALLRRELRNLDNLLLNLGERARRKPSTNFRSGMCSLGVISTASRMSSMICGARRLQSAAHLAARRPPVWTQWAPTPHVVSTWLHERDYAPEESTKHRGACLKRWGATSARQTTSLSLSLSLFLSFSLSFSLSLLLSLLFSLSLSLSLPFFSLSLSLSLSCSPNLSISYSLLRYTRTLYAQTKIQFLSITTPRLPDGLQIGTHWRPREQLPEGTWIKPSSLKTGIRGARAGQFFVLTRFKRRKRHASVTHTSPVLVRL